MDYVQIHPTSLYVKHPGRAFLISESCRGEGAILLDAKGNRFTDELQPRDVVSAAIYEQMEKDGTDHVLLSFERMSPDEITGHFSHIYERCLEEGYDLLKEPIPVVPAQHYFMGGVHVNSDSETILMNFLHWAKRLAMAFMARIALPPIRCLNRWCSPSVLRESCRLAWRRLLPCMRVRFRRWVLHSVRLMPKCPSRLQPMLSLRW